MLAEVELPDEDEALARPLWLGREVTQGRRYSCRKMAFAKEAQRSKLRRRAGIEGTQCPFAAQPSWPRFLLSRRTRRVAGPVSPGVQGTDSAGPGRARKEKSQR